MNQTLGTTPLRCPKCASTEIVDTGNSSLEAETRCPRCGATGPQRDFIDQDRALNLTHKGVMEALRKGLPRKR